MCPIRVRWRYSKRYIVIQIIRGEASSKTHEIAIDRCDCNSRRLNLESKSKLALDDMWLNLFKLSETHPFSQWPAFSEQRAVLASRKRTWPMLALAPRFSNLGWTFVCHQFGPFEKNRRAGGAYHKNHHLPVGQPSTNQPTNGKRTSMESMFQRSTALCITITVWTSVSHAPKIPHLPNPPRLQYEVQKTMEIYGNYGPQQGWWSQNVNVDTCAVPKKTYHYTRSKATISIRYIRHSPWSSPTRNCEMILAALLVKPMRPWAAASGEFVMQKKLGPKQPYLFKKSYWCC